MATRSSGALAVGQIEGLTEGRGHDGVPVTFEKVGRHRRIRAEDLFRYQAERDATRADALDDLFASDADLI